MWITFYQNLQNYYFHLNIYSTGAKPQFVRFYPSNSLKALKEGADRKQMAHTEPCPCLGNSGVLSWGTVLCQGLHTHQQRESRVSPWGLVPPQQRLPPWNLAVRDYFYTQLFPICYRATECLGWEGTFIKHLVHPLPTLISSFHSGHSFLLMRLRAWKIQRQKRENTNPAASTHTHWEQPAWPLLTPLGTGEGSGEKPSIRQRWRCKASSTILN